jgi:hypothetical protein
MYIILYNMSFKNQLKKLNIDPKEYLKLAKKSAQRNNLNPDKLDFSTKDNKKLQYENISFGATNYKDYIIYTLLKDPKKEEYRQRYQKSHQAIKGDWKDKLSPNALSLKINW